MGEGDGLAGGGGERSGLKVVREGEDDGSIIVPMARDRLLEIFERVQRPGEVASTLEGALTGQLWQQQMLFQAMVDTWPRLQKALREVKLAARKAPWRVEAHARRGEKPRARAERLAREVEEMVWGMKPDPVRGLKGFEGTVEELAMGYFMGHHVLEPHWRRNGNGMLAPVSTLPVPPRYYGYPSLEDGPDRLMLDRNGSMLGVGSSALEDFPKHRFLIAVNGGHSGHPAQAAPLRVLTGYWLAAVYGLKWFMQFAQLFGIPFRWATYPEGDGKAKAELAAMMGNLGSQGWAAFKQGVEMNFLESGKGGGNLAQAELLRLADEQCDVFVLGQTLTSSQGERGSQALGNVHMEVRREVVEGVCDFVGEILTHQLIPAMVGVNYGESRTDLPQMWARWPEPRDERGMAERDRALGLLDGKMPVERAWLYERHGVPVPGDGVELFREEGTSNVERRTSNDEWGRDGGTSNIERPTSNIEGEKEEAGDEGELTADDRDDADGEEIEAVSSRLAGVARDGRTWRGRGEGEGRALNSGRGTPNDEWRKDGARVHPGGAERGAPGGDDDATRNVVEAAFKQNQLRHPKGAPGGKGGEWVEPGGGGGLGKGKRKGKAGRKSGAKGHAQARKGNGGSYGRVKGVPGNHANHIPAKSVTSLSRYSGPAISMSAEDHRKTASYGCGREAKEHRAKQKILIDQGRFREAQQLDIEDIERKFPGKYQRQIKEMLDYTERLSREPKYGELMGRPRSRSSLRSSPNSNSNSRGT